MWSIRRKKTDASEQETSVSTADRALQHQRMCGTCQARAKSVLGGQALPWQTCDAV